MNQASGPVGTLEVALAHATRLLGQQPQLAAEQAQEILRVVPGHPAALLLLGSATRACGDAQQALRVIEPLARSNPRWAHAQLELGLALGAAGRGEEAIAALRVSLQLNPELGEGWRALAEHLTAIGDVEGADDAYARHIRYSSQDPRLMRAGVALVENRIAVAEALLREHLKALPTDVVAIRMLAEVAARLGRYDDSVNLLERCLELSPGFRAARHNYAVVLHRSNRSEAALQQVEQLRRADPGNPGYQSLEAAILARLGDYARSIELYEKVLAGYPGQARAWMSYGHALKTAGRQADSVRAYRRCTELVPRIGEAWWSLANLKTVRFTPEDLTRMRSHLQDAQLSQADRLHFHFALGKALEDAGEHAESFEHYARGNELRKRQLSYDPQRTTELVRRTKAVFTAEFCSTRPPRGCLAPDPIFIVGLPRSGSTLLEQVLASHPLVEGTQELPDIIGISRTLGGPRGRGEPSRYPEILATLDGAQLAQLGEQYLAQTRIQRKTDKPFFIDKMPNNWAHVGLIHLILPRARIIDARRHPLGCCFSGFKQHFARGQAFTYGLEQIGTYYRDYVNLMAHFDQVLPGRIHRVLYEDMIEDTEAQVRRLLDHCGLPFDERCLRFYETERAVRTASSEQVRQPIYRDGMDQWRHYEPWLAPLKQALGPVLDAYPAVPQF